MKVHSEISKSVHDLNVIYNNMLYFDIFIKNEIDILYMNVCTLITL